MASEQIVAALLKHESQRLETLVKDYSWWDAAIDNLLISFNETWADDNVGKYLAEAYGVSSSYVVGGNNDYVFVAADKEVLKPKNAPLELSSIVPLLALVRETSGEDEPISSSTLVEIGGALHVVAASQITSEGWEHSPVSPDTTAVLVLARLCLESGGNWFWRLSERVEFCGGQAARSRVSSAIS